MSSQATPTNAPGLRVIEPKLMLPRMHAGVLRRSRVLEMCAGDGGPALTVVSATVGYGKTTLLRSWCTERPEAVIWLTLDTADKDAVRLWTHLATAVERLGSGLGSRALQCLRVEGAPVETAVDEVMNGLVAYGRRAAIVLDDLHVLGDDGALRSIGYAIDRLPASAQLLVSTRSEPAIALARLRAARALAEIRARELAFTVDETRELITHEGIELSADNIELLAERTEGWPAGLYLAALWLRDLDDPNDGVRAFAGSTRHVGEYLTDEVLTALPAPTRDFLLGTSVLGRFTPSLCNAVLGRSDSAAVLAELARSNMFLVALDARGEWYRYHHLFAETLELELGDERARELRRRAAIWCREVGLIEDAIEYAAAAADGELVAELLVEHQFEFLWSGRIEQFLGWVRWLPSELQIEYPSLVAAGAVSSAVVARPEVEVRRLLAIAERSRRQRPDRWSPLVDSTVAMTRAAMIEHGDVGAAVEHARHALMVVRRDVPALTVGASATLSQALYFAGELAEARHVALAAVERPDAPERPHGYVASLGLLGLIDAEERRAESAEAWARQAIKYATGGFQSDHWTTSLAHLGLALVCAATGRLDEAEHEALRGEQLRRAPQPTVGHAHALLVLASVRVARSRLASAARDLERARSTIAGFGDPGRLPAIADVVEQALAAARAAGTSRSVVEAPSPAELAVLRGLAAGLSRRDIGAQLYISLNTVKTHTRELYRKLGASSRAEAVARAETLGLLGERDQSPG